MKNPAISLNQRVIIRDIRSGDDEEYGAFINDIDEVTGDYYVTKINKAKTNRACSPWEVIPKAMRFHDGTPARDGEDYVIVRIVGASEESTAALTEAAKALESLRGEIKAIREENNQLHTRRHTELQAVVETLCGFMPDPNDRQNLRNAFQKAIPYAPRDGVQPSPPAEAPAEPTAEQPQDDETTVPVAPPPPPSPRRARPARVATEAPQPVGA